MCIYNSNFHALLPKINRQISSMDVLLAECIASHSITWDQVIEANMAKLQKRYSSGNYSNKQAIERADKND